MGEVGDIMSKNIIYLLYFAIYTLLFLFFGKGGFKKTNNKRDFFVANKSFGVTQSIFTYCATWFSAASMQGVTGNVYAYGISTIFYSIIPWFLSALFHIILASKFKDYEVITVPEFFKIRYNSQLLQVLGGILIIITYILYIIIQITGFGIVISQLLDINYFISIFLIFLFTIYTTFGGLFSVARTHILNLTLVIISIILTSILVVKSVGGFKILFESALLINSRPFQDFPYITETGGLLHPFAKGQMPSSLLFLSFFGWGLGLAANPQYATRIISAKNKDTAKKMIKYSLIILSLLYLGLIIIGLGARVLAPSIEVISSVDEVFPYLINQTIYSPFSGLILIGICAAPISTVNSQLLLASSGFTYDIYNNLSNKDMDDNKFLNLNRVFIFLVATIALILSINPPKSLLEFGGVLWGFFSSTFLVPLYGGLLWKKATKEGALASFIAGLISLIIFLIKGVVHLALPGVIVSGITFYIVSNYYKGSVNYEK